MAPRPRPYVEGADINSLFDPAISMKSPKGCKEKTTGAEGSSGEMEVVDGTRAQMRNLFLNFPSHQSHYQKSDIWDAITNLRGREKEKGQLGGIKAKSTHQ